MDEKYNKYILQWREHVLNAAKALEDKNFVLYDELMQEAEEAYAKYKKDTQLTYECKNFGMANYIFEDALPKLFKSNKSAVREFINTIKEDKNLLSQFQFYKALEKNNDEINTKDYINESIDLLRENIDIKTINKSNKKLAKIISKYNIKPSDFISEDKLKMFDNCNYVFTHSKKLTNLLEMNNHIDSIVDYTKKTYNTINEDKVNVLSLIEDFDKKYKNILTEEEKDFVKEIMAFKTPENSSRKEKLFNKFKNECVKTVDKLIGESKEDEKDALLAIKEQISSKVFCEETLVQDMAKLLEIRDILLSE